MITDGNLRQNLEKKYITKKSFLIFKKEKKMGSLVEVTGTLIVMFSLFKVLKRPYG